MRNENIADLVRFFQAQEDTEEANPPKKSTNGSMDLFKAGQRRLRYLGQTKPEKTPGQGSNASGSSSEKLTVQRQQLTALQREGLLPGLGDSTDKSSPSRTKKDVEAIGRPWLDHALGSTTSNGDRSTSQTTLPLHDLRSESLSLGDLAALVEFSVSFPELYPHESSPPPYQARAQSDSQPQPESQQPSSLNTVNSPLVSATDRRLIQATHNGNEDDQPGTIPSGGQSRDSRVGGASLAPNKSVQGHRVAGAVSTGRQAPQSKSNIDKDDDDSCCGSNNCECDDAKSLAVLLRATERLGVEKKKSDTQNPREPAPTSATISTAATTNRTAPTKTTISTVIVNAATEENNGPPHSLNQGVTDTPLFGRKLVEEKIDGVQAAHELSTKASTSRRTDQPTLLSPAEPGLSKPLNAGPIPLKLVAECMSPTNSRLVTSPQQPLSPHDPRPQAGFQGRLTGDSALVHPRSASSIGPSLAIFPRPQALLSPMPIQSRRSRSATPDVAASDSTSKKGKKVKRTPLYVITNTAPLPPPAKPLPLIPQSAGANIGNKPAPRDRNISTPVHPFSAPLEYREEDRDSPILGMNTQKLRLRRSWIGPRPSSRYSSRSNDASDGSSINDDQTPRTGSPALSRPESRRGRADQVHALRMRDLDASKKKEAFVSEPDLDATQIKPSNTVIAQPSSPSWKEEARKSSRKHRVSAVPGIPLPRDPPVNAQGTPNHRRRNSATSMPGSIATTNGYEGGLSRSVSVTSGSNESLSIRHGKAAYPARDTTKHMTQRQVQPNSPLLPSSDEERQKHLSHPAEDSLLEARASERKTAGKQKVVYDHQPLSSISQTTQDAVLTGGSQTNYLHLVRSLESRVASLERQNKMLQAALLAALDMGVSHDADSIHSRSASPSLGSMRIPTISERSMLSPHGLGVDTARHVQGKSSQRHHKSRNASYAHDDALQESRGSFETTSSRSDGSLREIEVILSDVDVGDSTRKSRQ
ncbi:uncharacterized protein BHQ10_000949 [Talaromyces amestolkiae]|uniref:Uncharacterized protein n=1 Tax=Talaromyces amestolkiae TaxID=1196081 RepID=A0A364KN13_TALAM|nr:uncharacterized protein BHQ10_000949 [Talaromyces amestolkiae]RAO64937.1 hypothetical protein BHQ10_000949 [Talaromyces amestolkiae]